MARRLKAKETSEARGVMHIPLNAEAHRTINRWCEKSGGAKTTFVQRLIEWYASAPESLQAIIFNNVPADMWEAFAERSAAYFAYLVKQRADDPTSLSAEEEGGIEISGGVARRLPAHPRSPEPSAQRPAVAKSPRQESLANHD